MEEKKVVIEILKNPKVFIDYLQTVDDVYENMKDYNPTRKKRVLIVFDDMTADVESKKKSSLVAKMFSRGRKLNISFAFLQQS